MVITVSYFEIPHCLNGLLILFFYLLYITNYDFNGEMIAVSNFYFEELPEMLRSLLVKSETEYWTLMRKRQHPLPIYLQCVPFCY